MSFIRSITLMSIAVITLAGAAVINAQSPLAIGGKLRANIPFSFSVAGKVMPAGNYTIARLQNGTSPSTLILRGENGESVFLNTNQSESLDRAAQTALVLQEIGGRYFLTDITYKGEFSGNHIPLGKVEQAYIAKNKRVIPLQKG